VWFMPGTLSKGNVIICECNCWMFNLSSVKYFLFLKCSSHTPSGLVNEVV
jgi:hypothetical protein